MQTLRRLIQTAVTFLNNSYWGFLATGRIYQGPLKSVCAPGLNCYSCPAAVLACPMGSLQSLFASVRSSIEAGRMHIGFYVTGFLGTVGMIAGRFPCGWLCPFGFLQELLHKIPSKKFSFPGFLQYGKYISLFGFVILLPLLVTDRFGYGVTWFCKYLCIAGSLEAGIPLMLIDPPLRRTIGALYQYKLVLLAAFLVLMVFTRRPFCRTLCPLGGFYSFFNKVSLFRMRHDDRKCVRCHQCLKDCPMGISFPDGANQLNCIRCLKCYSTSCRYGAISLHIAGPEKPEKIIKESIA